MSTPGRTVGRKVWVIDGFPSLTGLRPPNGLPGKDGIDKLRVPDHEDPVDQHMPEAIGVLSRILECGAVNDARGIKDSDIGVGTDFDPPLPTTLRTAFSPDSVSITCSPINTRSNVARRLP